MTGMTHEKQPQPHSGFSFILPSGQGTGAMQIGRINACLSGVPQGQRLLPRALTSLGCSGSADIISPQIKRRQRNR